ncbi:MAG: hypothetical protein F6K00_25900 [Leptolyngbya sp. SIOISBB]|nr:hypothetical protein [Leptolyngbya sp. SIOISBB]
MIYSADPAKAETTRVMVDIPIYSNIVSEREVVLEAELLVSNTINQNFSQNPALTTVEVVVMLNRNGEVMPLSETRVSREDWQKQPVVDAWTRYYNSSIELAQRHNEPTSTIVASSSRVSSAGRVSRSAGYRQFADQLVDSGRMSGDSAQQILSDID